VTTILTLLHDVSVIGVALPAIRPALVIVPAARVLGVPTMFGTVRQEPGPPKRMLSAPVRSTEYASGLVAPVAMAAVTRAGAKPIRSIRAAVAELAG